ncbi:hypothetical protein Tco_0552954 [Tanacetum coccineum]
MVRYSDEESTLANDRISKADGYHVVPPPITGNFLNPRDDISFAGLYEYAIRKKIIKSKTTKLNADTSKSKTSETVGNTNEVNVEKPKFVNESVVSTPNINKDKVIIEDWNSDDENDVSEVSVNATRQNLSSQAIATSTARKKAINKTNIIKANPVKVNGVNTAKGNAVKSDVKGNWENVVKPSARCEWRPINVLDNVSKDSASMILKRVDYIDAHELAIPGQTATDKESSNPFMAGSLPKTIHLCDSLQSDEDKSLGDDASKQGRIDIGDIDTNAEITLIDETYGRINDIVADEDITLIPKLIIKQLKM